MIKDNSIDYRKLPILFKTYEVLCNTQDKGCLQIVKAIVAVTLVVTFSIEFALVLLAIPSNFNCRNVKNQDNPLTGTLRNK